MRARVCLAIATFFTAIMFSTSAEGQRSKAAVYPPSPQAVIEVCRAISPDVPITNPAGGSTVIHPSQIVRWDSDSETYTPLLTIDGDARIGGLFKRDTYGEWLFSLETPSTLEGGLATHAEPRDIVLRNGSGSYSRYFCGANVSGAVPEHSAIDAFFLLGGDTGDLILSFSIPTIIGGRTFSPSDLVRYQRMPGGTCASWNLAASNPWFNSATAGSGIPIFTNLIGVSMQGSLITFTLDVPTRLAPTPASATGRIFIPGEIVSWNGTDFDLLGTLYNWPLRGEVHGLATMGNPGRIGSTLIGESWKYERAATDVGMFEILYGGASGAMQSFARRGMTQDQMLKVIAYVRSLKKT